MASFLARRFGVMALTMLCLTLIVFYLVNLEPNLKKLAISQTEMHATSEELESWLVKNGYRRPFLERYAAWLGLWPKSPNIDPKTGAASPRFHLLRRSFDAGFFRRARRRFRLLDEIQGQGRSQARPGAARDRPLDVLGAG